MDDKKLMEQDLVLTYRVNRFGGKLPQVDLEGLWQPSDVERMRKQVHKQARLHKAELIRAQNNLKPKEEKKDARGKRKQK